MPRSGWFPVFAKAVRNHSKFKALTSAELGAWVDLRAETELLGDEPYVDRDAAIHVLTRRSSREDAAAMFDRLVQARLLDVDRKGRVAIHDLQDHSGRYPSEEPTAVVTRQRRSRSKRRDASDVTTGHESVTTGHDSLPRVREDETRRDESEDETRREAMRPREDIPPLTKVIDYLEQRTGREWHFRPGSKTWDTLEADVRQLGVTPVLAAMQAITTQTPDHGQLVFGASRLLHPIESPKPLSKEDRERAEARAALGLT